MSRNLKLGDMNSWGMCQGPLILLGNVTLVPTISTAEVKRIRVATVVEPSRVTSGTRTWPGANRYQGRQPE